MLVELSQEPFYPVKPSEGSRTKWLNFATKTVVRVGADFNYSTINIRSNSEKTKDQYFKRQDNQMAEINFEV